MATVVLYRLNEATRGFCERYGTRKTEERASTRMAELLSRRRADRSRSILGCLSCFEWMESAQCGLCADFRRVGRGRDADSRRSGHRRSPSQADVTRGKPWFFGCWRLPAYGASEPLEGLFRAVSYRQFRTVSRAHSRSNHTWDCATPSRAAFRRGSSG